MSIELYSFDTPNGRKISVALEEMDLPYEVHVVDISRGEQHDPRFVAISPNHKIPAIVDPDGPGGQPIGIFESGAILLYLARKSGRFWPSDERSQIAVLEWLMFQVGGFGPAPGQVHHFIALKDEVQRAYGLQRYMAETRRLYGVMDRGSPSENILQATCRSRILQSSVGSGVMRGIRWISPTLPMWSAGMQR